MLVFFFFQAEDGIRDRLVTGVQTCALPIYIELDGHGAYRYLRPVVRAETPAPARPAPKLGEHTEAVLAGIGYDDEKLSQLRKAKVI